MNEAVYQLASAAKAIPAHSRCFQLAATGNEDQALAQVVKIRSVLRNNRFATWDVELQLLRAYLLMNRGQLRQSEQSLRGIFSVIKLADNYNLSEKALMTRYALSVLWFARGKQDHSPLLLIRQSIKAPYNNIRKALLRRFPNPDER